MRNEEDTISLRNAIIEMLNDIKEIDFLFKIYHYSKVKHEIEVDRRACNE